MAPIRGRGRGRPRIERNPLPALEEISIEQEPPLQTEPELPQQATTATEIAREILISIQNYFQQQTPDIRGAYYKMTTDLKGKRVDLGEEEIVRLTDEEGVEVESSTKCLIGKVISNKSFNSFGLLEAMKRAMNPPRGFTANEIGKNLFSFQFRSHTDMLGVLAREPWHFDKNVILLKELKRGEQPSTITFDSTNFWVRLYDLPVVARTLKSTNLIGGKIGEVLEVDMGSMEGIARSVQIKVKVDFRKPLKAGIQLEMGTRKRVWIEFKYERLPFFRYLCGMLGHMRRECDLADGGDEMEDLLDEKLPFGEWMRVLPMKKATVSLDDQKNPKESGTLRRKLFERFKQSIRDRDLQAEWCSNESEEKVKGDITTLEEVQTNLVRVVVIGINESVSKEGDSTMTEMEGQITQRGAQKLQGELIPFSPNSHTKPALL
ncbi:hypothetical protein ACS0TY_018211 [Phlomoides rotata]